MWILILFWYQFLNLKKKNVQKGSAKMSAFGVKPLLEC